MLWRKVSILVFPSGPRKVKRFSLPQGLPLLLVALIIGLSAFSLIVYRENRGLESQVAELDHLRQKVVQQNVQIYAFADKIRLLEREMAKLTQLDKKLQAMTETTPEPEAISLVGRGGSDTEATRGAAEIKLNQERLVRQMHRRLERLLALASVQEQTQHLLGRYFEDTKSLLACTPTLPPLSGPITSGFGYRSSPFSRRSEFHRGVDISAPSGTPVRAPADGLVVSVDWNSGYGLILVLNHGYGVVTRYAHLSRALVEPGQRVQRGQKMAVVGRSGRTTGPHLHYEVILNGIPVNPMRYLASR